MKDTKDALEEFEIEELGNEEAAEGAPEEKGEKKKKNPFRFFVGFFGVLLFLMVAALAGTKLYRDYFGKAAQTGVTQEQAQELQAALEAAKAQEEALKAQLSEERVAGAKEGEQAVLDKIRESIENGTSVVETLRTLYSDQLVVASGGTYHFIPINDALKKNDYVPENLVETEAGELQYWKDGAVASYKGIDVSKFQGKIDWQKVAQDGVTFAFIRVGYRGYGENGTLVEDPNARENLQGANDAGIKTGAYFYTQAISEAEALEEVQLIIDVISQYRIDCPVVIDVEKVSSAGARMNKLDVERRTGIVKVFCDAVAAAGYKPMIYHNLEMGAVLLDVSQLEEYDKWFAYYKNELYYPYEYKVWQYSDKARVDGIAGDVDVNVAFEPLWDEN